jgi:uncharacterized damage-inducible protein DinB
MLAANRTRFASLERRRQALLGDLETLGDAALSFRPAPGTWSLLEVVHHLVLVEQGILRPGHDRPDQPRRRKNLRERVGCAAVWLVFKLGLRVKIPTNRVRPQPGLSLSRLEQEWAASRMSLEAYLDSTPASMPSETMFRHPIGGPMNVEQTLLFLTRHFDHHRRQISRIRRSGAFPA